MLLVVRLSGTLVYYGETRKRIYLDFGKKVTMEESYILYIRRLAVT